MGMNFGVGSFVFPDVDRRLTDAADAADAAIRVSDDFQRRRRQIGSDPLLTADGRQDRLRQEQADAMRRVDELYQRCTSALSGALASLAEIRAETIDAALV